MPTTLTARNTDRLFTPAVMELVHLLHARFGEQRLQVLQQGEARRNALRTGSVGELAETAATRHGNWQVDPVPAELLERRVELIGGCSRKELIDGMNAGAKSYVADLWDMTPNERGAILRAHKNIERAAALHLAYVGNDGSRVRINPGSTTRLMVVPRPLHATDHCIGTPGEPLAATFVDLALVAVLSAERMRLRQGGVYLYLRDLGGHAEARLWKEIFSLLEDRLEFARGTFKATVMMDSLAVLLEADEVLHELRHHSAGLAMAPQAFAADHVALFSHPDKPVLPDREHIGLNAHFLRSASLRTISICHRRQAHAIGAPAFVLPPQPDGVLRADFLEMLADKEREAVDGHDGTLVALPGLVNPAMAEFNKSMPRSHQMYFQRPDTSTPEDLVMHPAGDLTTEGMQRCIRTVLHALVQYPGHQGLVVQGGRVHDRTSIRLATLLIWHWTRSKVCFITNTGLEVHEEVVKYLIRKEGKKLAERGIAPDKQSADRAVDRLMSAALSPAVPPDLLEEDAKPGTDA